MCDDVQSLSLDQFIAYMLMSGKYDVDTSTGNVVGPQGKVKPFLNGQGYPVVNLVYNRKIVRRASVHRMIAVKVWGVEKIKGKQVGHLDGNTTHSVLANLWLPETAAEHVYFDGTHRNLLPRSPKAHWQPCTRCGDPNGRTDKGKTPDRITGSRFGIDGAICRRCYGALQERERRKKHGDVIKEIIEARLEAKS